MTRTVALLLAAGLVINSCSDSSTSPDGASFPSYTVLQGTVVEDGEGGIVVHGDSTLFLRFDDAIAGDSMRMTVGGDFGEFAHVTMVLFGDMNLQQSWDAFLLRTADGQLFTNLIHPAEGALINTDLAGPYGIGEAFTVRFEVNNAAGSERGRIWAPGDGFEDPAILDSDDYTGGTLSPSTGGYAGLILTGVTIRSVELAPIP